MSPKTTQQFNEIRNQRKILLMNAALKLFSEKGFTSTSISDIAKKAGVSKGLLYNYFESKDELVREIIIDGIKKITADFDFSIKLTKDRFIELIDKNFLLIIEGKDYWKLYISVITQPLIVEMMKGELYEYLSPFFLAVTQYYQEKNEKNPIAYTWLIGAILDGIGVDYMIDPENYPINEIKEIIISKLL
ncbi:putative Transcriptional regulator, TetR family [uncultured Paludibacter sp.]|nr:putative Transcriptional regulator, TetR family [uncultured Paludibacter sp.]